MSKILGITAGGRPVPVEPRRYSADESDPNACPFTRFDLTKEVLGPTSRYNCRGFVFYPRRGQMASMHAQFILEDNCEEKYPGGLRPGDIVAYRRESDEYFVHVGRVWQTNGAGYVTSVRSKWGNEGEYIHELLPPGKEEEWGSQLRYYRQTEPLLGTSDVWIKHSLSDDGEVYSSDIWWTSPDILIKALDLHLTPIDGPSDDLPVTVPRMVKDNEKPDLPPTIDGPSYDVTPPPPIREGFFYPHLHHQVSAIVRNRGDQRVEDVYVRYYWARKRIGLEPSDWKLIPASVPNPVGPIAVDGNSQVQAPPIIWMPPDDVEDSPCFMAIAYVKDDDPTDSDNPDPIVYPFEVPWDNNIAQRSVEMASMPSDGEIIRAIDIGIDLSAFQPFPPLDFEKMQLKQLGFWHPLLAPEEIEGSISAVLTYNPELSGVDPLKEITPLAVTLVLDQEVTEFLRPWEECSDEQGVLFKPDEDRLGEVLLTGAAFSGLAFHPEMTYQLKIQIAAREGVQPGSVYNLHLVQQIHSTVTGGISVVGGYTLIVQIT